MEKLEGVGAISLIYTLMAWLHPIGAVQTLSSKI